jgi:hypothetical protein
VSLHLAQPLRLGYCLSFSEASRNAGNKGKGASLFMLSLQDIANVESAKN